jgi:hypothetical protein
MGCYLLQQPIFKIRKFWPRLEDNDRHSPTRNVAICIKYRLPSCLLQPSVDVTDAHVHPRHTQIIIGWKKKQCHEAIYNSRTGTEPIQKKSVSNDAKQEDARQMLKNSIGVDFA